MRYVALLLFVCFATGVLCRPSIADEAENEEDDSEYDSGGDEGEAEDSLQEDAEQHLGSQEATNYGQTAGSQQNQPSLEPNGNSVSQREIEERNNDNFPSYKSDKNSDAEEKAVDETNSNEDYEISARQRQNNRYREKTADQLEPINVSNNDNSLKALRNNEKSLFNKRTPSAQKSSNEEEDVLFEKKLNIDHQERNELHNEVIGTRDGHSGKSYSSMQEGTPSDKPYQDSLNLYRDRRAAQDINETSVHIASNDVQMESNAEDEETAIKRHVKKLSGEELEVLLNSLSEKKRELLKKIMDSDVESDNEVNKREITKKASAAPDENINLEGGQSEASKLQEGSSGGESNAQGPSTELASKNSNPQTDMTMLPITKTLDSSNSSSIGKNNENKDELIGHDTASQDKLDSNVNTISLVLESNQAKADANIKDASKSESKREISSEEQVANTDDSLIEDANFLENNDLSSSQYLSNDPSYFGVQDEDSSQLADDESQVSNYNANILKREASLQKDEELSESMKSLEESFPNSNSYDDNNLYSDSELTPLVRVKRKNMDLAIKKRAAGILPDAKVAYVPYMAENGDDNDEGNEFDDDGFYDRTSNLAKSANKATISEEEKTLAANNNKQSDTMSLGSDTDSVLSGVEGVDDNLMFNSVSRNRRIAKEDSNQNKQAVQNANRKLNRPFRSTPSTSIDEGSEKLAFENNERVPNYHENDAFGPLPRNYEGELGRYKRIRRVKQPEIQEVVED